MSMPLKFSAEILEQIIKDVQFGSGSCKIEGKKVVLSTEALSTTKKAKLFFSPIAYEKQNALIQHCQKEVGWHGFVRRDPEDESIFTIEDIVVYPQEVTGSTITPDQNEYNDWLLGLEDEQFNMCRYHGHSHVNMATSPSGTDTKFQQDVIENLRDDNFNIFMIWNKSGAHWARIYDKKNNIIYNPEDVEIGVTGCNMKEFLEEADKLVRERKFQSTGKTWSGYEGSSSYKDKLGSFYGEKKAEEKQKTKALTPTYDYDDDDGLDDFCSVFGRFHYDANGKYVPNSRFHSQK